MSLYDKKYLSIVEDILNNGYYDNNRTGMPTYKLPHQVMQFNLEKEFPILTTKFVAFKTAVKEMLWIYRDQSNDVTKNKMFIFGMNGLMKIILLVEAMVIK